MTSYRSNAAKLGLIAAILTSMSSGGFAQAYSAPPVPDRDYQAIYNNAAPQVFSTPNFDMSGTRGRQGLGANPAHPEGPGNVSN